MLSRKSAFHWLALPLIGAASVAQAATVDPTLFQSLQWRSVGPFRGGRVLAVAGDPTDAKRFYFGSVNGGVWESDDAGRTWQPIFDQANVGSIGAIAVAPSNPKVIYVGTGEADMRSDIAQGIGMFRSDDGGRSWQAIGLADTQQIGRIIVDPKNPNVVLVAALGHPYGPNAERGVFRSTDGGRHWTKTLYKDEGTGAIDLRFEPGNSQIVYAAMWQTRRPPWNVYPPSYGPGSGLYKSTDGGRSWHQLTGHGFPADPSRIGIATSPARPHRVYALVDSAQADQGGLYRSDDSGASWRKVTGDKRIWGRGWYFGEVDANPKNADQLWVNNTIILRSDDGGAHFIPLKGDPTGDDFHSMWIDPRNPDRRILGVDQGTLVTLNGGKTWSSWYNQPTGQFYHLAADNRFPYWVYSGQQDSGTVAIASRSDYGAPNMRDWHPVGGDERDYDIPDPIDPNIVYGSGLGGRVSRWDARTGQVTDVSPWPVQNYGARPTTVAHHFNWVTPLVASRSGPPALYLGGEVVFKSMDRGASWSIISPDLVGKRAGATNCDGDVTLEAALPCGYGTITALEPSPHSAGEIWTGSDSGILSVTRNGGANWSQMTLPGIAPWSKISSIDLSPLDPATAYVAVDGQRIDDWRPHVFRTHDGGRSWVEVSRGLPAGQVVSSVRADPVRSGLLYAGNETGVFVSFDDGDNWQPLRQNLPTAWARDLLVHGDDLVVATQGRAIWVLGDLALLRQLSATGAPAQAQLFAPAPAYRVRLNNNHDTPLAPETPVGENPAEGAMIDYWLPSPARGPVTIEVRDASGALVRRFSSGDRPADLSAERYFAADWVKSQPVLSAAPGAHRWVWDLRQPRPKAVTYNYSIGAIPGLDTPLDPRGQLVEPGRYTVTLTVDGRQQSAPLNILPDPRVLDADYHAARLFSESLYDPMEIAWRGYAETKAVRDQLAKRIAQIHDPALLAEAKALDAKLEPPKAANSGFEGESGTLASLETSAESSDSAPSAGLRQIAAETLAQVNGDWANWQQVKATDIPALNRRLAAAGLQPITVPAPSELHVEASEGGEDLP